MMKKNGFVLIETIVAIVVLTTSLLLLYTSFSKILQGERARAYFDNISYVYRTWNIEKLLNDIGIKNEIEKINSSNYVLDGLEKDNWIMKSNDKDFFNNIIDDFGVNKIFAIKTDKLDTLKQCPSNSSNTNCKKLNGDIIKYIKTISFTEKPLNILVVEFKSSDENSRKFYSWVGVNE